MALELWLAPLVNLPGQERGFRTERDVARVVAVGRGELRLIERRRLLAGGLQKTRGAWRVMRLRGGHAIHVGRAEAGLLLKQGCVELIARASSGKEREVSVVDVLGQVGLLCLGIEC